MDMYTDVIIIVAALSVWLIQRENQVHSLLLLPSDGYHSKLLQGTVPSINADADEEICSFEEQERLAGMSCHKGKTNEKGKVIFVSKRLRQIQEKKRKE